MKIKEVTLGSSTIEISNPDKILYPEDGFSKADIVEYYMKIAQTMLPHIQDRPINMQRFPNGIKAGGFYEKQVPDYFPDWIDRVEIHVKERNETQEQVVCNDAATLAFLAEQGCITPHAWLSCKERLDYPDKMVFDLDPPGKGFDIVKTTARALKEMLEEIDMSSFVMTTGSRGLHVVVPLDSSTDFDTTREFAHELVDLLAEKEPKKMTTEVRKNKRQGRLFLDYLRNAYAQTSVPPYALRAISGAPIATPLEWEELEKEDLEPQRYTIKNIFQRLAQKEDPWIDFYKAAYNLSRHRDLLDRLVK